MEREFAALCRYRSAAGELRSPAILPIEHVNRLESGLFYVMPLCDGTGDADKTSLQWHPRTLASQIEAQRREVEWFSMQEIHAWITPILHALQLLSDAGLVHRDVKPDNILFLNGRPCLGDISLLGEDSRNLTRKGTPGYSAPSWFLETGGHPDMYGVAMTFYSLLTGNPPDKAGRVAFRWPYQGEHSLSPNSRNAWLMAHRLIARAVDERVGERFLNFIQFERAIGNLIGGGELPNSKSSSPADTTRNLGPWKKWTAGFLVFAATLLWLRSPTLPDFAQKKLESLIFPNSHPLSQHYRDCHLRLSEFCSEVLNESFDFPRKYDNSLFTPYPKFQDIISLIKSLRETNPEDVPLKVSKIEELFLSKVNSFPAEKLDVLENFKKTAAILSEECGGDVEIEASRQIQLFEDEIKSYNRFRSQKVKEIIFEIEGLLSEKRWKILENLLSIAKNQI